MIYLHTGRPGSGKTLSAIERGLAWVKEGRRVFVLGLAECDYEKTGFQPFEGDLSDWSSKLGPHDVLIVDEVQRWLPKGMTFRSVPSWVEELTRNRHKGVDLLFTTQDPRLIDSFVRRLVNEHRDFVAHWNKKKAKIYTWPIGVEEPDKPGQRKRADVAKWTYPPELFGLYKSAEVHTGVAVVPQKIKLFRRAAMVAVVCLVVGFLIVKFGFMDKASRASAAASSSAAHVVSQESSGLFGGLGGKERKPLTLEEWLERLKPRMEGLLWSAPLYDDRRPVSEPETYCMAMEGRKCSCISEQGTRVSMSYNMCMSIVHNGVYNPYRKPRDDRYRSQGDRAREATQDGVAKSVDGSMVSRDAMPVAAPLASAARSAASTGSNPVQVPQPSSRMDAASW